MNIPLTPAQLWFGNHELLETQTVQYLQKNYCSYHGCACCTVCKKIAAQQHYTIRWFTPEKQYYTVEQCSQILKELAFALDQDQKFFFIITHADALSIACANSLLKSLEEPPPGYYFILLAQRRDLIVPTILSRCVVYSFDSSTTNYYQEFLELFKHNSSPTHFMKLFDTLKITEQETRDILDQLLAYYLAQHKEAILADNQELIDNYSKKINIITKSYQQLPMPGSAKLFLRNIYLQIQ